jgi:transcriptional regulator with XRE-family HTH domain
MLYTSTESSEHPDTSTTMPSDAIPGPNARRLPRFRQLGARIRALRDKLGLTQVELAQKLEVTQPTVHRWEKGVFEPEPQMLMNMAALADMTVAEFHYGSGGQPATMVPVVGVVGAGAAIYPIDDHALGGGVDETEAPPDVGDSVVAVRVRGDSMYPAYDDGDLLFYSRDPLTGSAIDETRCLHRDCIVALPDGRILVKRLMRGSLRAHYTLASFNAPPIENVRISWASPVRWIRRR